MKKYQVIITFDNSDYVQTYFKADSLEEIIAHYKGYSMEYYDGSDSGEAYGLDIKDYENNSRYTYIYETNKLTKLW